jgi:hypothetical protein
MVSLRHTLKRSFSRSAIVRLASALVVFWAIAVWLLVSHDAVRESMIGMVLGDQTEYANGYSERALGGVRRGQPEDVVRKTLGAPLAEDWFYGFDETQPCMSVDIARDVVVSARDPEACLELGVDVGTARSSVQDTLGRPQQACWHYTRAVAGASFRERGVCFEDGKVTSVLRQWSKGRP